MTGFWIVAFLSLCLVVLGLIILVLGVMRRTIVVLERTEAFLQASVDRVSGLPLGSSIPAFRARSRESEVFTASHLRGTAAVLLFSQAQCQPCEKVAAELTSMDRAPISVPLFVVTDSSTEEGAISYGAFATVLYQEGEEVSSAFRLGIFPYAFAINDQSTIVDRSIINSVKDLALLAWTLEAGPTPEDPVPKESGTVDVTDTAFETVESERR